MTKRHVDMVITYELLSIYSKGKITLKKIFNDLQPLGQYFFP